MDPPGPSKTKGYTYTRLRPESRTIRVLELQPGGADDALVCRLVVQKIDELPYEALSYVSEPYVEPREERPYQALSYVWGDPSPAATIFCIGDDNEANNGIIHIGANLAAALAAFRHPKMARRKWVDAICINQQDLHERECQVRLMGDVFSTAQDVLCWLGDFASSPERGEATAKLAIDFLRKFNTDPHRYVKEAQQHLHFGETEEDGGALLASWMAIKEMFDIAYFHRAWIIQEVGLAAHAKLFWGNSGFSLDWSEIARFCAFMDDYGASVINHLQLKCWVCNHINLVWATKPDGTPRFNFVEVLHWARVHECTDPRDYIYALLGHPSAMIEGSLIVQPNYTVSMVEAYTELAVNVIRRTNGLLILAFVDLDGDPHGAELPSWVPDWHAINLVAPLRTATKAATETDPSISISHENDKTVLGCRGVVIDSVVAICEMIVPSELTVTTLEKERAKKTPFLVDHIWATCVRDAHIPLPDDPREFVYAMSCVLSGGFRGNEETTAEDVRGQHRADCAAFILDFERVHPSEDRGGFLNSISSEDRRKVEEMASSGSASQFIQDITWTSMCRRVFRTANGHFGLGPRIMKKDDVCVVSRGSIYPLILRRHGEHFELIGAALLYGFMDGETERLDVDSFPPTDFRIV